MFLDDSASKSDTGPPDPFQRRLRSHTVSAVSSIVSPNRMLPKSALRRDPPVQKLDTKHPPPPRSGHKACDQKGSTHVTIPHRTHPETMKRPPSPTPAIVTQRKRDKSSERNQALAPEQTSI
jgi:hypothetical protein